MASRFLIFNRFSFLLILVTTLGIGCVPSRKAIFFNDLQPSKDSIHTSLWEASKQLQVGDRININIVTKDPQANQILNAGQIGALGGNMSSQQGASGYLVDNDGRIELPELGYFKVLSLTPEEVSEAVRQKTALYYKDPVVYANVMGRVMFLGGGGVSGVVPITNNRLTILEAFAIGGTPALTSKRDKVWVIREMMGQRTYNLVDLNNKSIFHSPYFYLRNNDLIYVEPGKLESFIGVNASVRNLIAIGTGSLGLLFSILALTK